MSPVGERSCVKGNSKFTAGVFAEADEKFRENNDEIKRRNVCTRALCAASLGRSSLLLGPTFQRFPNESPFYAPCDPSNVGSGGGGIEIVSKIQRRYTRAEWLKRSEVNFRGNS